MSTIPGYTLEAYVMWQHDLVVENDGSANLSLNIAEALGVPTRRIQITKEQFKSILDFYEHQRVSIERFLEDFDEYSSSWKDYAGSVDFVSDEVINTISELRKSYADKLKKLHKGAF